MFRTESRINTEKEVENSFCAYSDCEDLLEKLKILKYEQEFLSDIKMRPLHKYYFVVAKNPGEQFYLFTLLSAWLIQKSGRLFEKPQEFDDPNATISKILDVLRENGTTIDFAPNKLKQGAGEHVVYVLQKLADKALQSVTFSWKTPTIEPEPEEELDTIEDEAEIVLDRVEEEMLAVYSDGSDDENVFHFRDLEKENRRQIQEREFTENVDQEAWKLELEKVLPQLKVTIRNDNRDWRGRFDQMKNYQNSIESSMNTVKTQMEKLHKEISSSLEKVQSRERYLNKELEPILNEYRVLQDQLFKVKDTYKSISGGVADRNRQLSILTDRLETVKQQMEERGSSMTDGTPLVNIKRGIAKIKAEMSEIDVRVGVLECVLLQSKLRDKKMLDEDLSTTTISVF